jgi:hypothetical protein
VRYLVDWDDDALEGLAAAWNALANKTGVNDANAEISRLLARDPFAVGSYASEGLRQLDVRFGPTIRSTLRLTLSRSLQIAFFDDSTP